MKSEERSRGGEADFVRSVLGDQSSSTNPRSRFGTLSRLEKYRDENSEFLNRRNDPDNFWGSRRRGRRSKSASPEEMKFEEKTNFEQKFKGKHHFERKCSTWSSDDDDESDERHKRGSSFSLSSLASRSSTLSRLFKLTDKNISPRKKSDSNTSLGNEFSRMFPDFYVAQPTSISSPPTPATFNRKSRAFENCQNTENFPKFTFRRESVERRSTRSTKSSEDEIGLDKNYSKHNNDFNSYNKSINDNSYNVGNNYNNGGKHFNGRFSIDERRLNFNLLLICHFIDLISWI